MASPYHLFHSSLKGTSNPFSKSHNTKSQQLQRAKFQKTLMEHSLKMDQIREWKIQTLWDLIGSPVMACFMHSVWARANYSIATASRKLRNLSLKCKLVRRLAKFRIWLRSVCSWLRSNKCWLSSNTSPKNWNGVSTVQPTLQCSSMLREHLPLLKFAIHTRLKSRSQKTTRLISKALASIISKVN